MTHATRWWTDGAGNGASGPAPPWHVMRFRGRKQNASSKIFPHVPEAPRRCSPCSCCSWRPGSRVLECSQERADVHDVEREAQSLCAEAVEPTQRTEMAVEGSGVSSPVDPKDLATWPGAHPASRTVQERRHHWSFGKSWLFIKTWRS